MSTDNLVVFDDRAEPTNRIGAHPDTPSPRPRIRFVMDRHQVRAILDQKKTKHVRLVKPADPDNPEAGDEKRPVKAGERIAVQKVGKGESTTCHVVVESVVKRRLGDMDVREANANGFRTTTDFARAYMGAADNQWRKLDADALAELTDEEVGERWSARWADRLVWDIAFHYDPLEEQRWLKAGSGNETPAPEASDTARGYTHNPSLAVRGEGPAVNNADLERYTVAARTRDADRRQAETAEQLATRTSAEDDIMRRFLETVAIARARGIDPRHQIRLVGNALAKLEQAIEAKHLAERKAA